MTVALQKVDCNFTDAYNDIAIAKGCIRDARNEASLVIWTRATQVAAEIGVTISEA